MMKNEQLLEEAKALQPRLCEVRRSIHRHPEVAFDLTETKALVLRELSEMGYEPREMGKAGVVALAGGRHPGKTFLLRADMDALPMQEEAEVPFCSEIPGKMHACGHDMHTAMLLGAARILKAHEDEIPGTVKLEFQPAEEIFQGSPDMIASGLLENPHVDAAAMLHVVAGMPLPAGQFMVSGGGISATSCEQYHITVKGKGGHGSSPENAIDPITAAAHIHLALQEINSRELGGNDFGVFTTGHFSAGSASNIIPDTAEMWGTIRTTDLENKVGALIRDRMTDITKHVAAALRCDAEVEFYDYCPCMVIDPEVSGTMLSALQSLFGKEAFDMSVVSGGKISGGSEDFAFISHRVPTACAFITAGNSEEGYLYGQHHPQVRFDDSILWRGAAAYTQTALCYLSAHA